jgi:hypothetical protein
MTPIKPPVDPKNPKHYIDNDKFYTEISKYHYAYKAAKDNGSELPQISNYLGECVYKIAKGIAMKHNFRNYSYIDDMISSAVEECLKYLHYFDPCKSKNPFSYFTQTCHFAFIHQIQKEHKQSVLKKRMLYSSDFDAFDLQSHDEDDEGSFIIPITQYINDLDSVPLELPKKKDKKQESSPLTQLFEDNKEDE